MRFSIAAVFLFVSGWAQASPVSQDALDIAFAVAHCPEQLSALSQLSDGFSQGTVEAGASANSVFTIYTLKGLKGEGVVGSLTVTHITSQPLVGSSAPVTRFECALQVL